LKEDTEQDSIGRSLLLVSGLSYAPTIYSKCTIAFSFWEIDKIISAKLWHWSWTAASSMTSLLSLSTLNCQYFCFVYKNPVGIRGGCHYVRQLNSIILLYYYLYPNCLFIWCGFFRWLQEQCKLSKNKVYQVVLLKWWFRGRTKNLQWIKKIQNKGLPKNE